MARFFNTTGFCNPERHYMVEPFRGMYDHIYRLIEAEQFFGIHAPRQTGKTTFLHALAHRLNREGKYIGMVFSVETAGVPSFTQEEANENMTNALYRMAPLFLPESERPAPPQHPISLNDYLNNLSPTSIHNILIKTPFHSTRPYPLDVSRKKQLVRDPKFFHKLWTIIRVDAVILCVISHDHAPDARII